MRRETRAAELLCSDLCLVESLRLDEISDGLGLREIDAPVEKGAHRELAGIRHAYALRQGDLDHPGEQHGRAVAGDLDDVIGSVGVRLGEIGDHHLVEALAGIGIEESP